MLLDHAVDISHAHRDEEAIDRAARAAKRAWAIVG
jgi:hypothetical protein